MAKKRLYLSCILSALLLCLAASSCAGSPASDVHQYDCDGIPLTIHADFSSFSTVPVAERKCSYASKKELVQIRDRIPWHALDIHDMLRTGWHYDSGMLYPHYPPAGMYYGFISAQALSVHRHENYNNYHPCMGWYQNSPYSRGRRLVEDPGDTRYDTRKA